MEMSCADIRRFERYVESFYGIGGLYDMNFSFEEIKAACRVVRLSNRFGVEFVGDSLDREHVLIVLEENFVKV